MALKRQTFDNGTQGATITVANSGTSGDSLSQVVQAGTGAGIYDTGSALRGTSGARITGVLNDTFTLVLGNTSDTSGSGQVYFRIISYPTVAGTFFRLRSSTGNICQFSLSTNGVLSLQNSTGGSLKSFNGGSPISVNTTYRLQLQAAPSASTTAGFIAGQLYSDSDTLIDSYSSSTVNAGTTLNVQTASAGKAVAGSDGFDMRFDELGFDTGTTTEIAPVASSGGGSGGSVANLVRQNFNLGPQGTTITAANSTTSGDALATILQSGTGNGIYTTAAALRGGKGAHVTGVLNDIFTLTMSNTSDISGTAQVYVSVVAYPTVAGTFFRLRSSTGTVCQFSMGATGLLTLQNSTGTTLKTFNAGAPLPLNTIYRLQLQATPNTSTTAGYIAGQLYDTGDNLVDSYSSSTVNAGTTLNVQTASAGKVVTGSDGFNMYIDEIGFATGTVSEIPPVVNGGNQSPTVDAGSDQLDIRPFALITIAATADDPDGTAPIITWTQIAGSPTVLLSGSGANRSFTAPATRSGTDLVFRATASDGQLSANSSVTVSVIPQAEWATQDGEEVPMRIVEV